MRPSPKTLILELLSTVRGETLPVRALVAAAELFGIAENSARVTLARLNAAGLVVRDGRGRYRLGEKARAVQRRVVSWRNLDERTRPWNGAWVGAYTGGLRPRPGRSARRRHDRALRLLGLRELSPGLFVRPDNLAPGVAGIREELHALGLDGAAPVFRMDELDAGRAARAESLWDAGALSRDYRASREALAKSIERMDRMSDGEATAEAYLLGRRVIRQLVLDPLLPAALVPPGERDQLVAAMRQYDALGRNHWRRFLARFDPARAAALREEEKEARRTAVRREASA